MNGDWAWLRRVQGSKSKFNCVMLFALLLPSTALADWQYRVGYWIWNTNTYRNENSSCADPADCVSVYETKQNIYYQNAGKPAGYPQLVLSCVVGDTAPPESWPNPTFSGRFTCKTTWWWLTVNGSWQAIRSIESNITLTGGTTTEPWHKKHDPAHLKANLPYKAIVKDQNGQPKADFAVTITTDVTSDSGGHVHTNGRPKGKLVEQVGASVSTKAGKETITGKTNGIGIFEFTFGAEEASGTHTLTAKCDSGCQAPATATVEAEIKGLMLLDADPLGYELRGEKDPHPGNHYYSPEAIIKIINLAHGYKKKFGEVLKINDSSLVRGGLFDISGNWTPSHKTHRKGIVVDINNYRVERDQGFERFALDNYGITAIWEGPEDTTTPHYHLLLLGERG